VCAGAAKAAAFIRPAEDRRSPGLLELALSLPSAASAALLTMEFEKAFLTLPEYPPDANHGFEVAAAVLHVQVNGPTAS
jgi:phosphatidylinositol glycan class T